MLKTPTRLAIVSGSAPLGPDALHVVDDLLRLAGVEDHRAGAVGRPHRRAPALADGWQRQPVVLRRIADDGLGITAAGDDVGLLQHTPAQQDDAPITLAEVLLRAVGNGALADPGHEVLVHDVAGDPASRGGLADRPVPVGDLRLLERR